MMLALLLLAAQLPSFLGGGNGDRARANEAQATIAAITDHCLPMASGGASGRTAAAIVPSGDLPARLRYPLAGMVPRDWDGVRAMAIPSRDGQVWVVAFPDGRCMVRAWGGVLVPVSAAVHALFRTPPWQPADSGWTATFTPRNGAARTVLARYTGEQVDNIDVQGDAVILLTPATPIG